MIALLLACRPSPQGVSGPNVLVVIADDMGIDRTDVYGVHPDAPPSPNLDWLASQGMLFRQAYANPVCSPTRATLLTGRHSYRTGIGEIVRDPLGDEPGLPLEERTLPEMLEGYDSSAVGKWHLGSARVGGSDAPRKAGFLHYTGPLGNIGDLDVRDDFDSYTKITDGRVGQSTTYATTDQIDDARIRMDTMSEPWLLLLGLSAPHYPLHEPPAHLHTQDPVRTRNQRHAAMIEALDSELGRLLDEVDLDDTYVVFLSDNGTEPELVTDPGPGDRRGKPSVFQGGVNVPFLVAGPDVERGETDALIHTVDLLPTVAEWTGTRAGDVDGVSFAAVLRDPSARVRDAVYSERFGPTNGEDPEVYRIMARDDRFKVIWNADDPPALYDLRDRIWEGDPLPTPYEGAAAEAYDRLVAFAEERGLPADR